MPWKAMIYHWIKQSRKKAKSFFPGWHWISNPSLLCVKFLCLFFLINDTEPKARFSFRPLLLSTGFSAIFLIFRGRSDSQPFAKIGKSFGVRNQYSWAKVAFTSQYKSFHNGYFISMSQHWDKFSNKQKAASIEQIKLDFRAMIPDNHNKFYQFSLMARIKKFFFRVYFAHHLRGKKFRPSWK